MREILHAWNGRCSWWRIFVCLVGKMCVMLEIFHRGKDVCNAGDLISFAGVMFLMQEILQALNERCFWWAKCVGFERLNCHRRDVNFLRWKDVHYGGDFIAIAEMFVMLGFNFLRGDMYVMREFKRPLLQRCSWCGRFTFLGWRDFSDAGDLIIFAEEMFLMQEI